MVSDTNIIAWKWGQQDTYTGPSSPLFLFFAFLISLTNLSLNDFHLLVQSSAVTFPPSLLWRLTVNLLFFHESKHFRSTNLLRYLFPRVFLCPQIFIGSRSHLPQTWVVSYSFNQLVLHFDIWPRDSFDLIGWTLSNWRWNWTWAYSNVARHRWRRANVPRSQYYVTLTQSITLTLRWFNVILWTSLNSTTKHALV